MIFLLCPAFETLFKEILVYLITWLRGNGIEANAVCETAVFSLRGGSSERCVAYYRCLMPLKRCIGMLIIEISPK